MFLSKWGLSFLYSVVRDCIPLIHSYTELKLSDFKREFKSSFSFKTLKWNTSLEINITTYIPVGQFTVCTVLELWLHVDLYLNDLIFSCYLIRSHVGIYMLVATYITYVPNCTFVFLLWEKIENVMFIPMNCYIKISMFIL